jgi:DNA-binding response OmpR family regulator
MVPGMHGLDVTERVELPTAASTAREILSATAEKPAPSVLIVEDESLTRWAVAQTLEGIGFAAVRASDGPSAIHAVSLARHPFDVIVLDLELAGDSLSLVSFIRLVSPRSVVIVTSAFDTPKTAEALQRGARMALRKPFEMRDVATAVLQAVGHHF